ncbi:hypothetical protein GCM10010218_47050 [Streptomyces mashuensis]|uniref:Uncharacterized protein n=1 Tax=Streptomyces mashuensis TaxID=33904 RepID=A0A919B5L5_9ACTN|nr:hypothetical protein [Streptomyces mashuensis]GHF60058.1 hypothetical protein GCM10010218_47050 [Streptomyces mashuensis]
MSAVSHQKPPLSVLTRPVPVPSSGTARHARPVGLYDSWWTVGGAALAIGAGWLAAVWLSVHVQADASLHSVALFVHLAALVLGFGAVLVADYYGLLWLTGRMSLADAMGGANRLHLPIWAGLAGLVGSGVFLHPNTSSLPTRVKLVMVLMLSLNGLQAGLLNRRAAGRRPGEEPGRGFLVWATGTALVSQICWWGAVIIGFRNSQR